MKLGVIIVMAVVLIALGAVYYFTSRPEPAEPVEPRYYVWDVEMDDLKEMAIRLPRDGMEEAWVKHEDKYWYFDEPDGPKVDMERWGGGVPLLLSGPGANRLLTRDATDEQIEVYGLAQPAMLIDLVLEDGSDINIEVGDSTLDGQNYYIRLVNSRNVFTVDYTWFYVLARLVIEPPYPKPAEE
ncbi:MAG: DUF4340 domain-containing protein [Spirochaetales bacterium]|nr:DUF4340 domain-containing protein [Spirochaetales bacterium]